MDLYICCEINTSLYVVAVWWLMLNRPKNANLLNRIQRPAKISRDGVRKTMTNETLNVIIDI